MKIAASNQSGPGWSSICLYEYMKWGGFRRAWLPDLPAGMDWVAFMFALDRFGLSPVGIDPDELEEDLANA
ncbi:MAG: hypothetical protein H6650_02645 [Ardenticatenales bacterium]|nr:hypothetical protein [Ardenticatenales bacterium]